MNFSQAQFFTSAPGLKDCPVDSLAEVAFAGRSNAGKSSAINALTGQSSLARTSKTPGRTQQINYFLLEPGHYLVDLPGYGFAQVPLETKKKWQQELDQYLRRRNTLRGLVLLSDIRHPLKEFDRMMIDWANRAGVPLHLLLTKSDKLKRGAANTSLLAAGKSLENYPDVSIQLFSAVNRSGVEQLGQKLQAWLSEPAA